MAKKKPTFPNRRCPKCGEPIHIKSKKHEACGWKAEDAAAGNGAPAKAASTNDDGQTTGSYFRRLFRENPKWLKGRSNEDVLQRWLADNPSHTEVPANIKAHLSNIKSTMRSKKRKKVAKRAEEAQPVAASHPAAAPVARKATGTSKLDALELQIDECLIAARQLDREGLEEVIQALRRARNTVVWKMGQ